MTTNAGGDVGNGKHLNFDHGRGNECGHSGSQYGRLSIK